MKLVMLNFIKGTLSSFGYFESRKMGGGAIISWINIVYLLQKEFRAVYNVAEVVGTGKLHLINAQKP